MTTATARVTSVTMKLFMTMMKVRFIDNNKAFDTKIICVTLYTVKKVWFGPKK
jgi:hypothetical protein